MLLCWTRKLFIFILCEPSNVLWQLLRLRSYHITKTSLNKYTENFTTKRWKFSDKNSDIFHISAQKYRLCVLFRTASSRYSLEPVLTSTHNIRGSYVFEQKKVNKNNVNPCKPHKSGVQRGRGQYYIDRSSRKHAYVILTPLNPTFI